MANQTIPNCIKIAVEKTNKLVEKANEMYLSPITYAGGTYPAYVEIEKITCRNQFVTIHWKDTLKNFGKGNERFNTRKVTIGGDDHCISHLRYTLAIINRAIKKACK